MIVAIWIAAAFGLFLWSLAAWGLHAVIVRGPGWADDARPWVEQMPYGALIERWVPGLRDTLELALDLMRAGLGWLGESAGWVVWITWGAGAALMAGAAGLFTLLVVMLRGKTASA